MTTGNRFIEAIETWLQARADHWERMPPLLQSLIAVGFILLALLGVMALWFGGGI